MSASRLPHLFIRGLTTVCQGLIASHNQTSTLQRFLAERRSFVLPASVWPHCRHPLHCAGRALLRWDSETTPGELPGEWASLSAFCPRPLRRLINHPGDRLSSLGHGMRWRQKNACVKTREWAVLWKWKVVLWEGLPAPTPPGTGTGWQPKEVLFSSERHPFSRFGSPDAFRCCSHLKGDNSVLGGFQGWRSRSGPMPGRPGVQFEV